MPWVSKMEIFCNQNYYSPQCQVNFYTNLGLLPIKDELLIYIILDQATFIKLRLKPLDKIIKKTRVYC